MAEPCTKFEVSSFSRREDISRYKILKRSPDPDLAPFREYFSLTGGDLQWLTYVPNLKSLRAAITKIWMAVQNVKIGVVWDS